MEDSCRSLDFRLEQEPVSSEISDLLLFVNYFASQSKGIEFGVNFFHVYCVIKTFWLDVRCQRWDRIRITGVDSGRILRFSFGLGSGPESKIWKKNGSGAGITFQFRQ